MPSTDKSPNVNGAPHTHLGAPLLLGITGTSPMTASPKSKITMVTSSVAAALAVLPAKDGTPRVIQQFSSVFLVSRLGELWRVYDADDPESGERVMPTAQSTKPHRLFLTLARAPQVRVFSFAPGAARDLDPVSLQTQLDASVVR